jgi:hypothetical protein
MSADIINLFSRTKTFEGLPAPCVASHIGHAHKADGLSTTGENKRLRDQRQVIWYKASATTRYWHARRKLQLAIWIGQDRGIPEGARHPPSTLDDDGVLLENYRIAQVKQLLTPAPTVALVNWKRAVLAKGGIHLLPGVKKEQIEKAIADDLAFLAAHPFRRVRR